MTHPGHSLLLFLFLSFLSARGQDSSNISLLDHWEDPSLPSTPFYNNSYNEVWGFVQDGREYAVIGSTKGTHIFDVSDSNQIQQVDMVPGASQGSDIVHRDFHDHRAHLYMVCDEKESTLQIADLSPLPDSVELVYDSENLLKNAHNIFIDSTADRLYAAGVKTEYNSSVHLMILDISSPASPSKIREYSGTEYFHDIYVRNDTAYGHHGTNAGLIVYDMSDPNDVEILGSLPTYTDQGYNHSGWLAPSGDHYVMADETHGSRLKYLNVSELSNIRESSLFLSDVSENSIAHNPLIHDEHVYVGHYHDGVQVWNVSDPENPVRTGYYDTYPQSDHDSYKGCWGVYPFLPSGILLASDMQSGLFVLNVDSAKSSLALEEQKEGMPEVRVHPTRARDRLNIEYATSPKGPLKARILDLRGRTLMDKEWERPRRQTSLDLGSLQGSGVRFLELRSADGKVTKKFIKQR